MRRYNKLSERFFSADLYAGKIDLNQMHTFSCYFIVQYEEDAAFIEKQVVPLLLARCRTFGFYGEKEAVWRSGLLEAHKRMTPIPTEDHVLHAIGWRNASEFVEAIQRERSMRPFVPHDMYLFYDDAKQYQEIIDRMNIPPESAL